MLIILNLHCKGNKLFFCVERLVFIDFLGEPFQNSAEQRSGFNTGSNKVPAVDCKRFNFKALIFLNNLMIEPLFLFKEVKFSFNHCRTFFKNIRRLHFNKIFKNITTNTV